MAGIRTNVPADVFWKEGGAHGGGFWFYVASSTSGTAQAMQTRNLVRHLFLFPYQLKYRIAEIYQMQHQQFKYYLNGINITYDTMIFFSQGLSEKLNMNSFIG